MLRPNPNFRDSSLHRIFNFGIRISGKSESIFQFWDFCESFNKNLAFFNKTWHFRLPNVKIFSHFSTKPRKIFAKSCESLANPGSESWKKDSNQSQIMKRDSNPGSRIRFGLNTKSSTKRVAQLTDRASSDYQHMREHGNEKWKIKGHFKSGSD